MFLVRWLRRRRRRFANLRLLKRDVRLRQRVAELDERARRAEAELRIEKRESELLHQVIERALKRGEAEIKVYGRIIGTAGQQ